MGRREGGKEPRKEKISCIDGSPVITGQKESQNWYQNTLNT